MSIATSTRIEFKPTEEDYGIPSQSNNTTNTGTIDGMTISNNVNTVNDGTNNNISNNTNESTSRCTRLWNKIKSEGRLLRVLVIVLILANLPKNIGNYILYPFTIFSTWIHESCHGIAALMVGGKIQWLKIYSNATGLALTFINPTKFNGSFVASAGYCGTAVTGGLLLLFRKIPLASRVLLALLAIVMIVTVIAFVRNAFGMAAVSVLAAIFFLGSYFLNNFWVMEVLAFVAAATCLNSVMYISYLFGNSQGTVGGEIRSTDAHLMQQFTGVSRYFWAVMWMLLSLLMVILGIFYGFESRKKKEKETQPEQEKENNTDDASFVRNEVV